MTIVVGAFEAKTHFSELLARVAQGETVTVTKHGTPVARMSPISAIDPTDDARRAVEEMRAARPGLRLNGLKIKDLIEEGRR